jgi:DNA ligase-1
MWYGSVDGDSYTTSTGKLNGKITTKRPTVCIAKNVGRANELSAEDQAIAELSAIYAKKRRQDFRDKLEDIDSDTRFKPMLAEKWADCGEDVPDDERLGLQPKLDGFRCVARDEGLETRDALPIPTAPHVRDALSSLFAANPSLALDGELYNHELHDDFNTISSVLRKKKPSTDDLIRSSRYVQYHVYDIPSHGDKPYFERLTILQELIGSLDEHAREVIKLVPTTVGFSSDVPTYLTDQLNEGYEGAIVRRDRPYQHKRSKHLLKVKKMLDDEFIIEDIEAGVGNRSDAAARVHLRTEEGQPFKVGIIGNLPYCQELLARKDEFIGQRGTVQFLRWTPAPRRVPYGGKFLRIRFS